MCLILFDSLTVSSKVHHQHRTRRWLCSKRSKIKPEKLKPCCCWRRWGCPFSRFKWGMWARPAMAAMVLDLSNMKCIIADFLPDFHRQRMNCCTIFAYIECWNVTTDEWLWVIAVLSEPRANWGSVQNFRWLMVIIWLYDITWIYTVWYYSIYSYWWLSHWIAGNPVN